MLQENTKNEKVENLLKANNDESSTLSKKTIVKVQREDVSNILHLEILMMPFSHFCLSEYLCFLFFQFCLSIQIICLQQGAIGYVRIVLFGATLLAK